MGSAIGNMGTVKFEQEAKTPELVKITTKYIASLAGAIGAVTGDPQLNQIGQKLGRVSAPAQPPPTEPIPPEGAV